jgi:membrane-associated protein
MNAMLPLLVSWMQQYGYPALWLSIFVAAVGIPLPISFVLLAAGAFAALGDFNIFLLGAIALTAAVCGDSTGYLIGYRVGSYALIWLEHTRRLRLISPQTVQKSRRYFNKRGGWAIFLSRFIVSALGGTINLLAGAEMYPYRRFLWLDISGEAIGVFIFLALGYTFGASWEAIGDVIGTTSLFLLAFLVTLYLAYVLIRMIRRMRVTSVVHKKQKSTARATISRIQERPDSLPL